MYFRQYWKDERLRYNHTEYRKRLAFNPEMLKFIWVPDTHFPGIKDGLKHAITDTNEVIRLWPDGSVLYSMRLVNAKYSTVKIRFRVVNLSISLAGVCSHISWLATLSYSTKLP